MNEDGVRLLYSFISSFWDGTYLNVLPIDTDRQKKIQCYNIFADVLNETYISNDIIL